MRAALLTLLFIATASSASEQTAPAAKPKLLISGLTAGGGLDAASANAMTDAIATEVSKRGFFAVMTANDVQQLIGLERQKQLLGCGEDSSSCLSELAGAIGVGYVMSGTLTRLGEAYQLTLQALDTQKATPLGRSSRIARDLETLNALVPYAVSEATSTPLPAPPSRVLPLSLMGAGAASMVGGGLVGFFALSQERVVNADLGRDSGLQTFEHYKQQSSEIGTQKTVSLLLLGAGALAIGAGIALLPADSATSGASASLLLTGNGAALVGAF